MKKTLLLIGLMLLIISLVMGCTPKADGPDTTDKAGTPSTEKTTGTFPTKDIAGIVQWGAGGGTDSLMRPLATLAEKVLGQSIVIQNKTGATGAIATQFVHEQAADGYTLLMGAENPQLYTILDISKLTYNDFEPVFLVGDERVGIVVGKDSKYNSFTELIEDALANPGKVSVSSTGKGGMPWTVSSFIKAVTGAEFNQIPFDSDAAALTAVLGGHADFTVAKVQTAIQSYKAGDLKFLTLLSLDEVDVLPEVPLVTAEYPDFAEYLPWGPFYGIFVKNGTPKEAIDVLSNSFSEVFSDQTYQELLSGFNISPLGTHGDEAREYLKNWQLNTARALYESGAIDKSPAELGLE